MTHSFPTRRSSDLTPDTDWAREWSHMAAAGQVMTFGVPGFFTPRFPPPAFAERQTPEAVSFYDTAPLAATLDRLVDWDRVNGGKVRDRKSTRLNSSH